MTAGIKPESPAEALRRAVAQIGSQSATGRLLGVTQATVSKWLSKSQSLPPEHVLTVEMASGVSKHDLRPDIYPRESTFSGSDSSVRFEHAR